MKLNKLSIFLLILFLSSYSFSMEQSSNTGQSLDTTDCSTPKLTEICCKKIAQELMDKSGNTAAFDPFWLTNLKNLDPNLQYGILRALFKYYPNFIWNYIKNLKEDKRNDSAVLPLTNLCGKATVEKLINNLHTQNNLNYLFSILQLPKELQPTILKALFKYHPDLAWEILPDPVPVKNFANNANGWMGRKLKLSSNGRFVFTTPDIGTTLWDLKTEKCISNQTTIVSAIAISYDNKFIVCQVGDQIKIWDIEKDDFSPAVVAQSTNIQIKGGLIAIAISPDNTLIAFSEIRVPEVKIFNLKTGECKKIEYRRPYYPQHEEFKNDLVLTDNKKLICSFSGKDIKIFNVENGKLIKSIGDDGCSISQISPNNKYIATADVVNKRLQVFYGENFDDQLFKIVEGYRIDFLALSSKLIAYILSNGTVKIINLQTKKSSYFPEDEKATIVALSPDGKLLVTCTSNFELKLWATEPTTRFIRSFKLESDLKMPKSIKISDNNDIIALDCGEGIIKIIGNI